MPKKKKILLAVCAAVLLPLLIWTIWSNTALQLTEFTIQSPEISEAFDGFRIAQVSDLHNGGLAEKVLTKLRSLQPDIIAITGDLIDSRHTDVAAALDFVEQAVVIAPCYYVTGNHESRILEEYALLKTGLLALGVTVLENSSVTLERDGETITILGIQDPAFEADYWRVMEADVVEKYLNPLSRESGFSILLSHRPEFMDLYAQYSIDLVLSGHVHGGQFRLPVLGGLFGPGQGFFPKYDSGLYEEGNTRMIVSRGIGNSVIPLRFNNCPEVILITLTCST